MERQGAGRPPGARNKATAEAKRAIKDLLGPHAEAAARELARLAIEAESEQARVAAIKEIMDRLYGKAHQTVDLDAAVTLGVVQVPEPVGGISEWLNLVSSGLPALDPNSSS